MAEELFVSVRTVESNLTRIYAKLGLRSRAELASRYGALTSRSPSAPGRQLARPRRVLRRPLAVGDDLVVQLALRLRLALGLPARALAS